ncbi:MAG TPA: prolyl oligopeptidase family serine peptidase [Solirubrobacterales bacterium]|nr:prolyl oligopeptidase family serine peptidase [Solirubrobacterales bacterium]
MSRLAGRVPAPVLGGLIAAALVVVAVVVILVTDDPEGSTLPPRDPGEPRVDWGEPESGDPTALVMVLHGGGWQASDAEYESQRGVAEGLQDEGYATVRVGYDEGATGLEQIEEIYEEGRRRYPDLPICVNGISAGGHLGLMLATREPDLDCVITTAAPTDLTTLAEQGGRDAYDAAVEAFGKDKLATYSPVRFADQIQAEVMMVVAESDPTVPAEQGREMARALPDAELIVLPPGPVPAVSAHFGGVAEGSEQDAIERELAFLQQATQGS